MHVFNGGAILKRNRYFIANTKEHTNKCALDKKGKNLMSGESP